MQAVPRQPGSGESNSDSDLSGDSDSEMLSSTSEASSLATSDSDSPRSSGSSPPGSPARAAAAPPAAAAPRVPALRFSLGALPPSADGDGSSLSVRLKQTAFLGAGSAQGPSPTTPRQPLRSARGGAPLAVEVLSQAFTMPHPGDAGQQQQHQQVLHATCAGKLGVAADRVRVYALVEVPSLSELPPRCERVAVEVKGSRFSLQALEQVLLENKNLASTATASDANIKQLQALLAAAQQENASLRKQLDSSEVLRHRSHSLLYELKQEFEALHTELAPHASPTDAQAQEGMSTPTAANQGRAC